MPPFFLEFERLTQTALQLIALMIDIIAAFVIAYAVGHGLVVYLLNLRKAREIDVINTIRLSLGKSLVLGLEFLIGADILRTSVAPSWTSIGQLGSIILLRSLLNYFLERELRGISHEADTPRDAQ